MNRLLSFSAPAILCLTAVDTGWADDPPAARKERLLIVADVTRSSGEVTHRIENNRYTVRLHYSDDIHGDKPRILKISSPLPGEWSASKAKLGPRLDITIKPATGTAATQPADPATVPPPLLERPLIPSNGIEYRFSLDFPLRQNVAEKHFDALMDEFRVETDKVVKKATAEQSLDEAKIKTLRDTTTRKLIANFFDTLPSSVEQRIKEYEKFQLTRLKKPRFLENRANPTQSLRNFFEWIETDKLLTSVKWQVEDRMSEEKILSLGQEIRDVLAGVPRAADQRRGQLKPADIEDLLKMIHVEFESTFTPLRAKGVPDDGWMDARRIVLSSDAASAVVWNGHAGPSGNEQRYEWLAFHAEEAAVEVSPRDASPTLAWAVVQGSDGWRYLRMASTRQGGVEPFSIRLSTPRLKDGKDRIVTVPARPSAPVKFPF